MANLKKSKRALLKGAIVGLGGYGQTHLGCLRTLAWEGRLELIAAVYTGASHEMKAAQSLKEAGCNLYLDVEEMLTEHGDQLDFCTLPTSIGSHVPLAMKCIERGIHCLVEKPLTGDISQLEQLEAAMKQHPEVQVTVGFQSLFLQEIISCRKQISEGCLGALKNIKVLGLWPRSATYYDRNNWAGRIRTPECTVYDSPLNNAMAHYLNLAMYWAGSLQDKPAQVDSVTGALYRAQNIENFDTASCRFQLDSGVPVGAWVSHSSRELIDISILVEGEKGHLHWQPNKAFSWELEGKTVSVKSSPPGEASLTLFRSFLDSVDGIVSPLCDNVPQAASHVRAIQTLQETLPIQDVCPSIIDRFKRAGESYTVINEIETLFPGGFEKDTLVTLPTA